MGIAYESAKTLKEGIVRFKERLHKLKQNGIKRESIVVVDIDGREQVPEAMLKRKNIRFVTNSVSIRGQQHRRPHTLRMGDPLFPGARGGKLGGLCTALIVLAPVFLISS